MLFRSVSQSRYYSQSMPISMKCPIIDSSESSLRLKYFITSWFVGFIHTPTLIEISVYSFLPTLLTQIRILIRWRKRHLLPSDFLLPTRRFSISQGNGLSPVPIFSSATLICSTISSSSGSRNECPSSGESYTLFLT